ncbi:MAG: hypothetical protein WCG44_02745 [bacterium]
MKGSRTFSQPTKDIDWVKIKRDLDFIESLQSFCASLNWRIVVFGGYGLDILLGQITRTHNDVDIVIYGHSSRDEASTNIQKFLYKLISGCVLKISENDFMIDIDLSSPGLGANIYYVQTGENPFANLNKVVKKSGEMVINSQKRFPPPITGKLDKLEIDVQNPNSHLADIIFKQRTLTHKPTHDQDIANLRQITSSTIVDEILSLS